MASLATIAKRSGVSRATVATVLRGEWMPSRPSAIARAERIRQIALELGYRPNAAARAVSTGRFGNITLILGRKSGRSTLPTGLLWGIGHSLASHDYRMTLQWLGDKELTDEAVLPSLLREASSDGLLIDYTHDAPPRMAQLLEYYRIPAVWLNTDRPHDCVRPDDFRIAQGVTKRLLALGHSRIAYCDWSISLTELPTAHYSYRDRQAGYERALADAGLKPMVVRRPTTHRPDPGPTIRALLSGPDRPTACVTYAANFANWLWHEARHLGLEVPLDLSLATFVGHAESLPDRRTIAAAVLPESQVGDAGVQLLMEKIGQTPPQPLPSVALPAVEWIDGLTLTPRNS